MKNFNELMHEFIVHPRHERAFTKIDPYFKSSGEICSCGHPRAVHDKSCLLSGTCGCQKFFKVLSTEDIRPFFQVTHGPMDAHALSRGMKLAKDLGVNMDLNLHCKNYCKNYSRIGACRHPKVGWSIQVRNSNTEKHVIYCNHCMEDLCLTH